MSVLRAAYSAVSRLLVPVALVRIWWRGRCEPDYRRHVRERLGLYETSAPSVDIIWVHAVSVGETRAAEPLVRALMERHPQSRILLTHTTPTGRRMGVEIFGDAVLRAYLPYDTPGAVARFLDHFKPRLAIVMETEVWPNLVTACMARHIPTYLVNARLSEKSYRGYARVMALAREGFGAFSAVAAQTREDAQRLEALGARAVHVTGNIKFDADPSPDLIGRGREWRSAYGERRVLLAASTRDGEETLLLDALPLLSPDVLFVIVPRHPQRFDAVAALLDARGVRYERRSAGKAPTSDARVLLGDSMGEMPAYYAASDLAFIGGSLLPFGAQNLIEACAVGTPVLIGPSTYNFAEATEQAIVAGAALRVASAEDVMRVAGRLLGEPQTLAAMSERALAFARAHRGATQRLVAMVEKGVRREE